MGDFESGDVLVALCRGVGGLLGTSVVAFGAFRVAVWTPTSSHQTQIPNENASID